MENTLLFVYNANSNHWNKLFDAFHKAVSPETYACDLCKLTHGMFKEKDAWVSFKKKSAMSMAFLYKDQFLKLHGSGERQFSFPVILQYKGDRYRPLVVAKELQALRKTEDLIRFLQEKLKKNGRSVTIKAAS